jgi:hypothetical protein
MVSKRSAISIVRDRIIVLAQVIEDIFLQFLVSIFIVRFVHFLISLGGIARGRSFLEPTAFQLSARPFMPLRTLHTPFRLGLGLPCRLSGRPLRRLPIGCGMAFDYIPTIIPQG